MTDPTERDPAEPTQRVLPDSWKDSHRFVPRAFVQPTLSFMRLEASGGIVMLVAALLAIAWANSPWGEQYFALFEATIEIAFGGFHFEHLSELTVRDWVNDALMVIFFFVVGLEIKRELVVGELRDPKAAALPAMAALGGMVVPAAFYLLFNVSLFDGEPRGWGIPMATDIAFAIGVVSMVGRRVPVQAKLFLLALAIVDDLGAILVIALFYTDSVSLLWLAAAAVGLAAMYVMQRVEIRSIIAYLVVGVFVWLAVLESGVHATVAGVAIALLTPVKSFYDPRKFAPRARELVSRAEAYVPDGTTDLTDLGHHAAERVQIVLQDIRRLASESIAPLDRMEFALARWSSFLVVPVFAFANAGVAISGDAIAGAASDPVLLGVFVGLLVGKVVGVTAFAWLAVALGIGKMPARTTWSHIIGVGMLSGIGFTVALFVAALSFDPGSDLLDSAKIGIFAASLLAGLGGYAWLRFVAPDPAELDANRDGVLDTRQ